ncbi:MAG: hypothetical protein LBK99_15080, partial [Opitutaceae bacterium]|nr:hypothetical protein [Opitutaceae bacterium]
PGHCLPPPLPPAHVIVPEEKGFFNTPSARINLARVRQRDGKNADEIKLLQQDHQNAHAAHSLLSDFTQKHPLESVSEKRLSLKNLDTLEQRQSLAIEQTRQEISRLEAGNRQAGKDKNTHDTASRTLRDQQTLLRNFVTAYEQKIPAKNEEINLLENQLHTLAKTLQSITSRLEEIASRIPKIDSLLQQERDTRQKHSIQNENLPPQFIGNEPEPDAGDDIDGILQRFQSLRQNYEQRVNAGYYDVKIEGEQNKINELQTEQQRAPDKPPQTDIDLALLEPDLDRSIEFQNEQLQSDTRNFELLEEALHTAKKNAPPPHERKPPTPDQFHPELGKPDTTRQADDSIRHCDDLIREAESKEENALRNLELLRPKRDTLKEKRGRYDQIPRILEHLADKDETASDEQTPDFSGDDTTDYGTATTLSQNYSVCENDLKKAQTVASRVYEDQYLPLFNDPELVGRTIQIVEKFRQFNRAEIEARIDELVTELTGHHKSIEAELTSFEANRQIILKLMDECERNAASVLRATSARSVMSGNMGIWAGQQFLRITLPKKNDPGERRALLDKILSEWIDPQKTKPIPIGAKLAYHCLVAIAGHGQIDVKILKSEYTLRLGHHDILKLKNFSGGEQVTAAIILYCIIVKLRAQRRARATTLLEDSGFLLLDNPIGKANLPDFVEMQVDIASRMGVQYICGTGIDDFNALAGFPKIIRMRNTSINPDTGANIVEVVPPENNNSGTLHVTTFGKKPPLPSPPPAYILEHEN